MHVGPMFRLGAKSTGVNLALTQWLRSPDSHGAGITR